ncbi:MAG TPA: TraB/GumN family protein [Sphingomicrobium sp.]|nr:TraB/GumN family protein [Sphingomicrobium sp.]
MRISRTFIRLGAAFILAAAGTAAPAEPALWKVKGAHATVYLFGTIHTLHADTKWHSPKIDRAFGSAGTLYEEVENVDDPSVLQPLIAKYGLDPAHPLSGHLDDSGKSKLSAVAAKLGAPEDQLEKLRPWFAATQLSILPLIRAGYDPKAGVDVRLRSMAVAQGKKVRGFETLQQEMQILSGLPEPLQVQFLLSTLDDADKGAALFDDVVAAWSKGDVTQLQTLLNKSTKLKYAEIYQKLFVERNRAFAKDIAALLKGRGTSFVAIGAGHLAGPDSVQKQLAHAGYTIVRE